MMHRRSPYVKYNKTIRHAEILSKLMPLHSVSTGISFAKAMEFRYREIFTFISENHQAVTGSTAEQSQEFAKSYYGNQIENYITESHLCELPKARFTNQAAKSVVKSVSDEAEHLLIHGQGPIVLAAFHFSTFFHLCTGLAELVKGKKTIHVLAHTLG